MMGATFRRCRLWRFASFPPCYRLGVQERRRTTKTGNSASGCSARLNTRRIRAVFSLAENPAGTQALKIRIGPRRRPEIRRLTVAPRTAVVPHIDETLPQFAIRPGWWSRERPSIPKTWTQFVKSAKPRPPSPARSTSPSMRIRRASASRCSNRTKAEEDATHGENMKNLAFPWRQLDTSGAQGSSPIGAPPRARAAP